MLHYHPQLVSLDKIPDHGPAEFPVYDMYPARAEWVPASGVLSSAMDSSTDKGKLLVTDIISGIIQAVRFEFRLAPSAVRIN
ncbi:Creatinine amidohydrolase [compost metagenome]